jgi:hypothetical protein
LVRPRWQTSGFARFRRDCIIRQDKNALKLVEAVLAQYPRRRFDTRVSSQARNQRKTRRIASPRLHCPAGQRCPKDGYWLTPAKADSRRFFKAGEIMLSEPAACGIPAAYLKARRYAQ